jgi:hypothetical protein
MDTLVFLGFLRNKIPFIMKLKASICIFFLCISCKDLHENDISYPREIINRNKMKQFDAALWCAYTFNIRCYSLNKLGVVHNNELPKKYIFLLYKRKISNINFFEKNTCFILNDDFKSEFGAKCLYEYTRNGIHPVYKVYINNMDALVDSVVTYNGRVYAPLLQKRNLYEKSHSLINLDDSCKISLLRHNEHLLPSELKYLLKHKLMHPSDN